MRISIKLKLHQNEIPIYYRTALVSYLKKLMEDTPYFDLYYNRRFPKPFTFAVYLPLRKVEGDKIFLNPTPIGETFITWNLSFADPKLGLTIVSRMLKVREYNWRDQMKFEVLSIDPREEKFPEGKTKVIFKTLSPVLVRKRDKDGKRRTIEIDKLCPQHNEECKEFEEEFNRVQERIFKTLGYPYRWIKIKPIEPKGEAIRTIWSNTDGKIVKILAYSGLFELEGPSEVLKLLYQKGLGEKTAEGFGMVEVHQPNTI